MAGTEKAPLLTGQGRLGAMGEERAQSTYWLARLALYRAMGGMYFIAFLVSAQQNKALLGPLGLEPVTLGGRPTPAFSLLGLGDWQLDVVAWTGVLLSLLMAFSVVCSCILPLLCWLLYLSIVNLESGFIMNYSWEWQVLETGFLVIFLYPALSLTPVPKDYPPPFIVLYLLRWLAFRVMFGTGMSKLGGAASDCWRELTCTTTHYETQPIPNAAAWFMHHLPVPVHKLECAIALFVEVPAPFLFLAPLRNLRLLGVLLPSCLMACIVLTGSYAYINFITLVPFLACLDDAFLSRWVFSSSSATEARESDRGWAATAPAKVGQPLPVFGGWGDLLPRYHPLGPDADVPPSPLSRATLQRGVSMLACLGLAALVAVKSAAPVRELSSPSPWLHFYDDYFFVNAYGVFGFINQKRVGAALEYTHDNLSWIPLDFPAVPGSVDRMPAYVTPYHYRCDGEVWIYTTAVMEKNAALRWEMKKLPLFMQVLAKKVLAGDTQAASLLAEHPSRLFAGGKPPRAVRATPYLYTFSNPAALAHGVWWHREPLDLFGQEAEPLVLSEPWSGPVSRLPPSWDWVLLFSTLGAATAFAGPLVQLQGGRPGPKMGFAAAGVWAGIAGVMAMLLGLPTWQACWMAAAIVAVCALLAAHFLVRLLGELSAKACLDRVSLAWALGSLATLCLSFFLTLTGNYWAALMVMAVTGGCQASLLSWLLAQSALDELLAAAVGLTLAAAVAAAQTALFRPPARP